MIRFLTLAGQSPQNYATENINKDVNFKECSVVQENDDALNKKEYSNIAKRETANTCLGNLLRRHCNILLTCCLLP